MGDRIGVLVSICPDKPATVRFIRNGIPYGPGFCSTQVDAELKRGMGPGLVLGVQTSFQGQVFEIVQESDDFPEEHKDEDGECTHVSKKRKLSGAGAGAGR